MERHLKPALVLASLVGLTALSTAHAQGTVPLMGLRNAHLKYARESNTGAGEIHVVSPYCRRPGIGFSSDDIAFHDYFGRPHVWGLGAAAPIGSVVFVMPPEPRCQPGEQP